ncbi:MAG: DUF2786 domain-containing protein [Alphaproteobacteria bacterium]|nr:DUF2786 domain-containing protein [Alphaproteobacteria bacterium]
MAVMIDLWFRLSPQNGANPIARQDKESAQERFHNLLALAAKSPFEGERAAAFQAAERLAQRHGLSMEEAAQGGLAEREPEQSPQLRPEDWARQAARDISRFVHLLDSEIQAQKMARDRARAEAIKRGLDAEIESGARARTQRRRWVDSDPRRMDPRHHASVLLRETQLPLEEVVAITGLDIYQVVGLKLKMRAAP